jgi:DNA polymerase III delta prime subunit
MSKDQNPFKPTSLSDFVISDPAAQTILESILNGRLPFPMLGKNTLCLWGTYGTGKTTLAELLPKLLEQSEMLPTSDRGGSLFAGEYWTLTRCGSGSNSAAMMQDINRRIASDISYSPSGWHYEIFDEVDMLTQTAQGSLKATISQAKSTFFVFTTNHLQKVDRGLLDRAYLIEMNQPKPEAMEELGRRFLQKMGLTGQELDSAALLTMAESSRGSMREFGNAVAVHGLTRGGSLVPQG